MSELTALQAVLAALCGSLVGFSLGLVGGGGSILAVPLLVYVVGVHDPHIAIGTSALAVAANAAGGLYQHARHQHVRWRVVGLFALAGVCGAWIGSTLGKAFDGQRLLVLFALLMLLIAGLMLRHRQREGRHETVWTTSTWLRLLGSGAAVGGLSGFFGIGGGFLIVPSLMFAAGLPILLAIGSSLAAVTAFGLTTALNYARAGWVDWPLAALFIVGGLAGSRLGSAAARRLSLSRGALNVVFAGLIVFVAAYMLYRGRAVFGVAG